MEVAHRVRPLVTDMTGRRRIEGVLRRTPRPLRRSCRRLLERIPDAENLGRRVATNSGWMIGERLLRMGVVFALSVWMARHLGAEDFGTLAFGMSLLVIVQVVATMGMRPEVVKDLLEDPDREPETIGSALALHLIAGSLGALVALALLWWLDPGSDALPVFAVLALGLPLNAISAVGMAFEASLQSRYAFIASGVGLGAASAARLGLLLAGAPLIGFAIAGAIEVGVTGLAFAVIYRRQRMPLLALRYRWEVARRIAVTSWPLFAAALAAIAYLRADQVMLQALAGSAELGVYAVAARLSEIWYFIPVAMGSSLLPLLVANRRDDAAAYDANLQRTINIAAWLAIALAVGVTLIAAPLIGILYTDEYAEASSILRIHVWAAPFIFMGGIVGRALVAEGRTRFELARNLSGATVNIGLNLVLIPRFGGIGAAIATLISYSSAAYFSCLFYPPVRPHFWRMTRALVWPLSAGNRT